MKGVRFEDSQPYNQIRESLHQDSCVSISQLCFCSKSIPLLLAGDLRERAQAATSSGQLGMLGAEAFLTDFLSPREEIAGNRRRGPEMERSDAESPESLPSGDAEIPRAEDPEPHARTSRLVAKSLGAYSLPASPILNSPPKRRVGLSRDPRLQNSEPRPAGCRVAGSALGDQGAWATATAGVRGPSLNRLALKMQQNSARAAFGATGPPPGHSPLEYQRTEGRAAAGVNGPLFNGSTCAEGGQVAPELPESIPLVKGERYATPAECAPTQAVRAPESIRKPRQKLEALHTPQTLRASRKRALGTPGIGSGSVRKRVRANEEQDWESGGVEVKVEAVEAFNGLLPILENGPATAVAPRPLSRNSPPLRSAAETAGAVLYETLLKALKSAYRV
jgi:hypothetical protein